MGRVVAVVAALVVLLGVLAVVLYARLQPPVAAGPPEATLIVLTGAAQVTRAGSGWTVARGGDQLRAGDGVTTGPGARAQILFTAGDRVRLDSGTAVRIASPTPAAAAIEETAGRSWSRAPAAIPFAVTAAGRTLRADAGGAEFAVEVAAGSVTATVFAGSVADGSAVAGKGQRLRGGGAGRAAVSAMDDAELHSPWAVLNSALDSDAEVAGAAAPGPSAIGTGVLLAGEESSAQQAVAVAAAAVQPDLVFTADWQAGNLELVVIAPGGAVYRTASGPARPLRVVVHPAASGAWQYRVRDLGKEPGAGTWFVLVSILPR